MYVYIYKYTIIVMMTCKSAKQHSKKEVPLSAVVSSYKHFFPSL